MELFFNSKMSLRISTDFNSIFFVIFRKLNVNKNNFETLFSLLCACECETNLLTMKQNMFFKFIYELHTELWMTSLMDSILH